MTDAPLSVWEGYRRTHKMVRRPKEGVGFRHTQCTWRYRCCKVTLTYTHVHTRTGRYPTEGNVPTKDGPRTRLDSPTRGRWSVWLDLFLPTFYLLMFNNILFLVFLILLVSFRTVSCYVRLSRTGQRVWPMTNKTLVHYPPPARNVKSETCVNKDLNWVTVILVIVSV